MSPLLNRVLPLGLLLGCETTPPQPAAHACYDLDDGDFVDLSPPERVVGVGLSYAEHIKETGGAHTPGAPPPMFDKVWSPTAPRVTPPTLDAHLAAAEALEPGLPALLRERGVELQPLLDYEVELGIVLLEDVSAERLADPGDVPQLGFFVANDLSDRALAILGDGQADPYAYWGVSKSFPGFLPAASRAWVPSRPVRDGLPCLQLQTRVNGELRQDGATSDLIFTTTELLSHAAGAGGLRAGTWILTGTPSGVAIQTPPWKIKAAELLRLDRFRKLAIKQRAAADFLQPGDVVEVRAGGLGAVQTEIGGR